MGEEEKKTHGKPDDVVGVGREASATGVLLITGGADGNGVLHGAYFFLLSIPQLLSQPRLLRQVLPLREASRGFMSKTSTPSILPRISRRSRPVACSRSVGTVPGAAPGPKRSSLVLISVCRERYICQSCMFIFVVCGFVRHPASSWSEGRL